MEEGILGGMLCMILVFAVFPLLWWRRRRMSCSSHEHEEEPQQQRLERVVHHSGTRRMRRRPTAVNSFVPSTSGQEPLSESDEEEVPEDDNHVAKASTRKEKKRQEREAQRQAEDAARESRKVKQDRYEELRRRKDEDREAKERAMEEEALARRAKEEETAALEFDKWKGEFSVDAEGTTTSENQKETQGLLNNFVEYIQKQKCISLEDLAAEFKLRTQDCINRIVELENMGRLSGVMDDRGKYIYISPEEMQAVAEYIKRKGRVRTTSRCFSRTGLSGRPFRIGATSRDGGGFGRLDRGGVKVESEVANRKSGQQATRVGSGLELEDGSSDQSFCGIREWERGSGVVIRACKSCRRRCEARGFVRSAS